MGKKTPLFASHLAANAKMVDFAGWEMPLHYGSQLQEHHYVRQQTGVFDVSHMTMVDCKGADVQTFLRHVLANNIDKLIPGKALYSCMLNHEGGIIDDLIVYQLTDTFYRLIVNSATREKDLTWLQNNLKKLNVTLQERDDLAMLAIQGATVLTKVPLIFPEAYQEKILQLTSFSATFCDDWLVARTGYTGEDGFEIMLPASEAVNLWQKIIAADVKPCGLGARDTLRLEAGLNLYGLDMDESVSPLESNLSWTVAFQPQQRNFIGRTALEKQLASGVQKKLIGLILEGPGVLRHHQKIMIENIGEGEITSGGFSPTLNKGIALARIPLAAEGKCVVEMRGGRVALARIIKPPFRKNGAAT